MTTPEIYNTPIVGKYIARVDTLEVLKEVIGEPCFAYRKLVYAMIAGTDVPYNYKEIFASFYRKYPDFREYVNEQYYYGDTAIPIVNRVVTKLRDVVCKYRETMSDCFNGAGGKYLLFTHDYIYYAFKTKDNIPNRGGVSIIC